MTDQALDNIAEIERIRKQMLSGVLTYDEAKAQATPIIDSINKQGALIAKKYNKKASKITFASLMR